MMFHPEANHRSAFLKSSVNPGVLFGGMGGAISRFFFLRLPTADDTSSFGMGLEGSVRQGLRRSD